LLVTVMENVCSKELWVPSLNADDVMLQFPEPSAVAVPSNVVPSVSYNLTVLLASAVPVKVVVVSLVMLSVTDVPESDAKAKSGVDGAEGVSPVSASVVDNEPTVVLAPPDWLPATGCRRKRHQ